MFLAVCAVVAVRLWPGTKIAHALCFYLVPELSSRCNKFSRFSRHFTKHVRHYYFLRGFECTSNRLKLVYETSSRLSELLHQKRDILADLILSYTIDGCSHGSITRQVFVRNDL